jgi:TRAP-type C4-dicarboxylate transport system permease small subunit
MEDDSMADEKVRVFDEVENYIASLLLGVMVIASTLGVVFRYILQQSLSWSEELSRFSFIWFCYFAAPYVVIKKSNIIIDLLDLVFGKRGKRFPQILRSIGFMIWLGFSLFMVVISYQFIQKTRITGEVSAGLGIPIEYVYWSVPVGFALMSFRLVQQRTRDYRERRQGTVPKTDTDTRTLID